MKCSWLLKCPVSNINTQDKEYSPLNFSLSFFFFKVKARGGVLTEDDIRNYSSIIQKPAEITYQGKYQFSYFQEHSTDLKQFCEHSLSFQYLFSNQLHLQLTRSKG